MEAINPGDRVAWVNKALEGEVTHIINHESCMVALDNGLEIEAHLSELTRIERNNGAEKAPVIQKDPNASHAGSVDENSPGDSLIGPGIYLVRSRKPASVFILNKHAFDVLFAAFRHLDDKRIKMAGKGELKGESYQKLDLADAASPAGNTPLTIQMLLCAPTEKGMHPPVNYHFNPSKARSFSRKEVSIPGTTLKGLLYRIDIEDVDMPSGNLTGTLEAKEFDEGFSKRSIAELDLHIEELTKHYASMDNAQMLRCQMAAFDHALEKAIHAELKSIVFIHGVGEGVLKNAIRDKLRQHPDVKTYRDASAKRYGKGATEALLK